MTDPITKSKKKPKPKIKGPWQPKTSKGKPAKFGNIRERNKWIRDRLKELDKTL